MALIYFLSFFLAIAIGVLIYGLVELYKEKRSGSPRGIGA